MAWEARGNRQYYYRSRRVGNRVRKEYLGRGLTAKLADDDDIRSRASRQEQRIEVRTFEDSFRLLVQSFHVVSSACREAFHALHYAAGYRKTKSYNWRKYKDVRMESDKATTELSSNQTTPRPAELSGVSTTLDQILQPIREGRKDLIPVLRSVLQRNPHLWEGPGDIARRTLTAWAIRHSGNDDLLREQLLLGANQLRYELLTEDSTSAEKLLVERVLVLQQQAAYFEMLEASSCEELVGTKLGAAVNKRQEQASRQLSDAIRQLQVAQKLQSEIRPTRPGTANALRVFSPQGKRRTA